MTSRSDVQEILRRLFQRPIAFYPMFAEIGGDATTGLFLSQLFYWSDKSQDDGWVYKTYEQWHAETYLTRRDVERARIRWKDLGVLEEKLVGLPARLHYRVDLDELGELVTRTNKFVQTDKLDCSNGTNSLPERTNIYNTETTTETTTESTQYAPAPEPATQIIPLPLTNTNARSILITGPMFVEMGKQPATAKGRVASDRVEVTREAYEWARTTEGWRGSIEHLQKRITVCVDYYKGTGKRHADWQAVFRNWIRGDVKKGEDVDITRGSMGTANPQREQQNGQAARGYGYNADGQPNNKATQLQDTAFKLAERQRARRMGGQVGGDDIPQRSDYGGGS